MAGRKRKMGHREPNGRLQRPSVAKQLEQIDRDKRLREMSVVLAQPHRQGNTDQRCESAFGRFCLRFKLAREIYDAGLAYADLVRIWRAAKGVPTMIRLGTSGTGEGPSDATVREWSRRILRIEKAMDDVGTQARLAVQQLVLEDFELGADQVEAATLGLLALAVEMGRLPVSRHPFFSARVA